VLLGKTECQLAQSRAGLYEPGRVPCGLEIGHRNGRRQAAQAFENRCEAPVEPSRAGRMVFSRCCFSAWHRTFVALIVGHGAMSSEIRRSSSISSGRSWKGVAVRSSALRVRPAILDLKVS
jgi:hypothetical protein